MKSFIIAANWKMNKTNNQAREFVKTIKKTIENSRNEIIICPPYTALETLVKLKIKNLKIGAQNIFFEDSGTYTGEISAEMLKDIHVECVLVGHSERRAMFGDSDAVVSKKLKVALKNGFDAILCIGETYEEKLAQKTHEVLKRQLDIALKDIKPTSKLTIAYEPVWAISSGDPNAPKLTPTSVEIGETHTFIKNILNTKKFKNIKILYGGSANDKNCVEFSKIKNVDGFLIGGASLDTNKFSNMITLLEKV